MAQNSGARVVLQTLDNHLYMAMRASKHLKPHHGVNEHSKLHIDICILDIYICILVELRGHEVGRHPNMGQHPNRVIHTYIHIM